MRFLNFCRSLQKYKKQNLGLRKNNVKESGKEKGSRIWQLAAAFNASFSTLGVGEILAWTSPALIFLVSKESEISIKTEQKAWLASMNSLGTIIGFLMISLFMDRFGRKKTMMIYAIPQTISWLMIILGKNFTILCIARIIAGWGCGGATILTTVYMAEITEKEIRGMFTVFLELSSQTGIFIVALMGTYLSYQNMNLLLIIPSILYLITLPFVPESPYFYFMKNQEEESIKSLMKLRGKRNPESVMLEVEEIKRLTQFQESIKCNLLEFFTSKSDRKTLMIVSFAHLTFALSGSTVMLTYTQEIFGYSGFSLSPADSATLLGGVKIISGLIATQLIDRAGRRYFFLFSGMSAGISLTFVGIFFFLKYRIKMDISSITWMPLAGLLAYEIACPLGISSVPHIFTGELFSIKVKKTAVTLVFLLSSLITFILKLIFPLVNEAAGIHTTFFIFALCCFTGTLIVFCIAPETRGKSLDEIQTILNSR